MTEGWASGAGTCTAGGWAAGVVCEWGGCMGWVWVVAGERREVSDLIDMDMDALLLCVGVCVSAKRGLGDDDRAPRACSFACACA